MVAALSSPAPEARVEAEPKPRPADPPGALVAAFAILFGVAMSLCVQGYGFGKSNHTIYLLDALRQTHPELLTNDWFTTQTLQYHALFGKLSAILYRLSIIQPAFLVGYLLIAAGLHYAWYAIVRRMGGGLIAYLVSVLLFYLSAGGFGLGMYQFLQDSSFLPSNVANVALLAAIALWMYGRYAWAGGMIGVAGLFHLNHAVVGIGLWGAMVLWDAWRPTHRIERRSVRAWTIGTALAIVPCAVNIALALGPKMSGSGGMPFADFVDLYVRLRHPHHYDPSSWPIALWVCFLWPIPLAIRAWWTRRTDPAWSAAGRFFSLTIGLVVAALLGAGIFYVSESLVQMSLYRFSIYPKLLTCVAATLLVFGAGPTPGRAGRIVVTGLPAILIMAVAVTWLIGGPTYETIAHRPEVVCLFVALCCGPALCAMTRQNAAVLCGGAVALLAVVILGLGQWTGFDFDYTPDDPPDYLAVCEWARDPAHTPIDATFLVPPDEQSFRLYGQRAIVVNYKAVPQLSGELGEWRTRMCAVLGVPTLLDLPRPFSKTVAAMSRRYESLPPAHLDRVAERYGARYIVAPPDIDPAWKAREVFRKNRYVLYDRQR